MNDILSQLNDNTTVITKDDMIKWLQGLISSNIYSMSEKQKLEILVQLVKQSR